MSKDEEFRRMKSMMGLNEGEKKPNIIYTAIFFDVDDVLAMFPQEKVNLFSSHSTIAFKPSDGLDGLPLGEEINVEITGCLTTAKLCVALVNNPLSKNPDPHITLSTAEGVKPFESNTEIMYHKEDIVSLGGTLKGRVGYFNGKEKIFN